MTLGVKRLQRNTQRETEVESEIMKIKDLLFFLFPDLSSPPSVAIPQSFVRINHLKEPKRTCQPHSPSNHQRHRSGLTGHEGDLAEQNPFHGKVQVHLQVTSDAVVQFYGDISRMLHIRVSHVIIAHWFPVVVLSADAEVDQRTVKHLVGGERDGKVQGEFNLHRTNWDKYLFLPQRKISELVFERILVFRETPRRVENPQQRYKEWEQRELVIWIFQPRGASTPCHTRWGENKPVQVSRKGRWGGKQPPPP